MFDVRRSTFDFQYLPVDDHNRAQDPFNGMENRPSQLIIRILKAIPSDSIYPASRRRDNE